MTTGDPYLDLFLVFLFVVLGTWALGSLWEAWERRR